MCERFVGGNLQLAENRKRFSTVPFGGGFGRKETKGLRRPDTAVSAVSEVRTASTKAFETKRNFAADGGRIPFHITKLAEGKCLISNVLWWNCR
jgi:hypothetical protein